MTKKVAPAKRLSPQQNTKVETLAEAIETLVAGTSAEILGKTAGGPSDMAKKFLADARSGLRDALKAFLLPALHIVEDGPRQPYMPDVPREDRVECGACHRHFICADANCPEWHKAIQAHIKPAPDPDEGNDAA